MELLVSQNDVTVFSAGAHPLQNHHDLVSVLPIFRAFRNYCPNIVTGPSMHNLYSYNALAVFGRNMYRRMRREYVCTQTNFKIILSNRGHRRLAIVDSGDQIHD